MLTETDQISNFRSEDISKEILLDLVRKNVLEFSDKFFHFQYAILEMFKGALNNYSMLKLRFLINIHSFAMQCKNASHQYYATNQDTKPLSVIAELPPKQGQINVYLFLFATASFITQPFFPLKGKLKYIINFPSKISNDIIQCYQFSHQILPLMSTDITRYYWTKGTQSLKSMNPIQKMSIYLSRI